MDKEKNKIFSSANLHQEFNEERRRQGLEEIPINQVSCSCGSSGNLARKDNSWTSIPDFFKKMFKGKK